MARAPDFPLYGLDDSWTGPRWVGEMSGPGPLATLSLSHLRADGAAGIAAKSIARRRYAQWRSAQFSDPVDALAHEATADLLAVTWPDPEVMTQVDWLPRIDAHADRQARHHRRWHRVTWWVDGAQADAAIWSFAGAWTGFTVAIPEVYIVVTAIDVDPHLRLVRLATAARYGFELGADITISQMSVGGPLPKANSTSFHPDHYAARDGSPY